MKITKETLKKIIKEEIDKVLESKPEHEKYYPDQGTKAFDDQQAELSGDPHPDAPATYDEEMVNLILNKLVHMGVKIPDVVGLEPEQLAGAIAFALEKWKKG